MQKHRAQKYRNPSDKINHNELKKTWFERNPSLSQFILTIFTIIITSIFSFYTIKQSSDMFSYSQKKDRLDSKADSIEHFKQDTITNRQLKLSEEQNRFIARQLKLQGDQFQLQYRNDRVVFVIDSIQYRERPVEFGDFFFFLANKGRRNAKVVKVVHAMYNLDDTRFIATNNPEPVEVVDAGWYTIARSLPKNFAFNASTVNFIRIFYVDNGVQSKQDLAFVINFDRFPKIYSAPVSESVKTIIYKRLRLIITNSTEFLDNPHYSGRAFLRDSLYKPL